MFKTTADLRDAMIKLYQDIEHGRVTNAQARTRAYVAKTILDSVKVEIAATALGREFGSVSFDNRRRPKVVDVKANDDKVAAIG